MHEEIDNSPDDKLAEAEALEQAEEQGITFVDTFYITEVATFSQVSGTFNTRDEAEAEFKKNFKINNKHKLKLSMILLRY